MQLEDVEADATEDELAAGRSTPSTVVKPFERRRPARKPFPEHLPRERVRIPAPQSCPGGGSTTLSKLGEDVTETLEVIPRQWKVIQTVRERFAGSERGAERAAFMYALIRPQNLTASSAGVAHRRPRPPTRSKRNSQNCYPAVALAPTSYVNAAHAGGLPSSCRP
jgi:hypothetical protein